MAYKKYPINDLKHNTFDASCQSSFQEKISVMLTGFPNDIEISEVEIYMNNLVPNGNYTQIEETYKHYQKFSGHLFVHFQNVENALIFCKGKYSFYGKELNCRALDGFSNNLNRFVEDLKYPTRVFVQGIPLKFIRNDVKICFLKFGKIEEVVLILATNKNSNNAYIKFANHVSAKYCAEEEFLYLKKGPVFELSYVVPKYSPHVPEYIEPAIAEYAAKIACGKIYYIPEHFINLDNYLKLNRCVEKLEDIPVNHFEEIQKEISLEHLAKPNEEIPEDTKLEDNYGKKGKKVKSKENIPKNKSDLETFYRNVKDKNEKKREGKIGQEVTNNGFEWKKTKASKKSNYNGVGNGKIPVLDDTDLGSENPQKEQELKNDLYNRFLKATLNSENLYYGYEDNQFTNNLHNNNLYYQTQQNIASYDNKEIISDDQQYNALQNQYLNGYQNAYEYQPYFNNYTDYSLNNNGSVDNYYGNQSCYYDQAKNNYQLNGNFDDNSIEKNTSNNEVQMNYYDSQQNYSYTPYYDPNNIQQQNYDITNSYQNNNLPSNYNNFYNYETNTASYDYYAANQNYQNEPTQPYTQDNNANLDNDSENQAKGQIQNHEKSEQIESYSGPDALYDNCKSKHGDDVKGNH